MGFATASSLRGSPISYTGHTAAFLRRRLLSRAGYVSARFYSLPDSFALVLKVLEHIVNDVSPERLVEEVRIESDHLVGELAGHKRVNRHLHVLFGVEGALGPRLGYK